ncbi:unnamed protein product [Polarella glacialis]|nr:unnamed protein product [Polarella glacialis]
MLLDMPVNSVAALPESVPFWQKLWNDFSAASQEVARLQQKYAPFAEVCGNPYSAGAMSSFSCPAGSSGQAPGHSNLGGAFNTAGRSNDATDEDEEAMVQNLKTAIESHRAELPWGRRGPFLVLVALASQRGPLPWDDPLVQALAEASRQNYSLIKLMAHYL